MHMNVDYSQVQEGTISTEDTNGTNISEECIVIPVLVPLSEVADWLAAYDPTSSTSPSEADSRKIARVVLDALKKYRESHP